MFDEVFKIFVYKRKNGKICNVKLQGVYRVVGDSGIEVFTTDIFNFACDGYTVEIEKLN